MFDSQSIGESSIKVGIAEMRMAREADGWLATYALGSCVGVTVYDPKLKVGGILHYMLPAPSAGADKSDYARFGLTGIPELFRAAYALGSNKSNLVVCAVGASEMLEGDSGSHRIGARNKTVLRKLLWKNGVHLAAEELGGNQSRTLALNLHTGEVFIRAAGKNMRLYPKGDLA